ncbi:UDPglucose 6-dehydrogenase [Lysinibacillus parviboronicapiens]|uniref:UDP-glucose 6-dehydrogenase n=1 Tax=Lysinibacillus parviboronicapiens TaxID=436516 RepID=A0ABV2PJ39_9BACI
MNVGIIGTGYVGLVTGAVLSDIGHVVTCLDINEEKINRLKKGQSPIYEPGLDEILARNTATNRLYFTTNAQEAFAQADIIFIAVGTPQGKDGAADLSYIEQAAKDIAINVDHNVIVVVKSTVPVGTNDKVEEIILENMPPGLQVHVVSNPEFLREGHAINDTFYGDRIVIGAENSIARDKVESLFKSLNIPIVHTNRRSAEMIKYASNAFLAVKISYINQISNLCEAIGADVNAVADGVGMDHRIGRAFLNAGIGYGGSCFPKDTEALAYLARKNDVNLSIVQSAIQANGEQRHIFVQKVISYFKGELVGKKIAILGLAFKPNTDDMREAPAITIIEELLKKGAHIKAYDPIVKDVTSLNNKIKYANTKEQCVENVDAILIVTEWEEFVEADWKKIKMISKDAQVFDGRNILTNK